MNVKVFIDANWGPTGSARIMAGIQRWEEGRNWSGNNSGVTYQQVATQGEAEAGAQYVVVEAADPTVLGPGGADIQTRSWTSTPYNGELRVRSATMRIDRTRTDLDHLEHTGSHEIGHLYNLENAPLSTCGSSTSVMGWYEPGYFVPTPCDQTIARDAGQYPVPDFFLSISPDNIYKEPGNCLTASHLISVIGVNGFAGVLNFSSQTPVGWPCGGPLPVTAPGETAIRCDPPAGTQLGTFPLSVTGQSADLGTAKTVVGTIIVSDYAISVAPETLEIPLRGTANYTVSLARLNGWPKEAWLKVDGLDQTMTATFSPQSISSQSTLAIKTTSKTPQTTYRLTVRATLACYEKTYEVVLVVRR